MNEIKFIDLDALARHLRNEMQTKQFALLCGYNGAGKTRLSGTFKSLGKEVNLDGETTKRDTLYFNAFTEDLFSWHNDLDSDSERYLMLHPTSTFFAGLEELEMENRIRPLLHRYADFDFKLDKVPLRSSDGELIGEQFIVRFFRDTHSSPPDTIADNIKISRGEENLFIWCFFLAVVELAMIDDGTGPYHWVDYVYIDDPISSLDEHNAIAVACHLVHLLKGGGKKLKVIISTHHTLFFNVLSNELRAERKGSPKKAVQYFLSTGKDAGGFILREQKSDTPSYHHVANLKLLHEAEKGDLLFTHHFNMMRAVLEKTALFHGYGHFSMCLKEGSDTDDAALHQRLLDVLSHGNHSVFEPDVMPEELKRYFAKILRKFRRDYPFNPALFPEDSAPSTPAPEA
ncbi:AAA family ATPase [Tahibacter sp.]|uniref:AAA family ATPase n=1 Tax=Tahibacter sp. TaxID=2056211 RepID=UPI0028C3859F|nr:AAA family ATPase [Tahibacter sp.]